MSYPNINRNANSNRYIDGLTPEQRHERWKNTQQERIERPFNLGTLDGIGTSDLELIEFQNYIPRHKPLKYYENEMEYMNND